ncbi:MAG: hypothetical protein WAT77_03800 [Paracoccaceae bacterium]
MRWLTLCLDMAAGLIRATKSTVFVLLILGSIALNIASLTVSSVSAALSGLIYTVSGATTLYDRARLQFFQMEGLKKEHNKVSKELKTQKSATKILAKEMVAGKKEIKAIKTASEVDFKGRKRTVKEAAEEVASSVKKRVARSTTANVGSIAAEGIPYWGIAINAATTALELKLACDSMKDMDEFLFATGALTVADPETKKICGIELPSTESIWNSVKIAPRAIWIGATKSLDTLGEVLPEPNFSGWWQGAISLIP